MSSTSVIPSAGLAAQKDVRRKHLRWMDVKENLTGYLFILPSVLIITLFGFFPIGYALYMSVYSWRVKQGAFIAMGNYQKLLGDWVGALMFALGCILLLVAYMVWNNAWKPASWPVTVTKVLSALVLIAGGLTLSSGWGRLMAEGDKNFLNSLPVTLYYAIGTVPAEIIIAMVLAYILFQNIRGKELFRMIYFLPYVMPFVATALVFYIIFSPRDYSLANQVLELFGQSPLKWLFEPKSALQATLGIKVQGFWGGPSLALVSIIFFGIWTYIGYNTVIFMAGLGAIPHELYEAAEIDGAGKVSSFRHITLPLLSPVTFYLALVAFIGTFKAFNHIYVMRMPSAQDTVNVASVTIFETFYKSNQYGYAAAQAILLFLIILGLTYANNKIMGSRVFYG